MKRAVLCVENPQDYIDQLNDYSIMIVNPNVNSARLKYLLEHSDYTLLITENGEQWRDGQDYPNEKVLWYTSGTTGDSKFCSFSQAQVDLLANKICQSYNIDANDRYVSIMPLWHAHGQGFYWATKFAKCEQHYANIKELRRLHNYSPTFITAIPDILKLLKDFDFSNLRFMRSASAGLPNALYTELKIKFNIPIIEAFGMTEALSHCFTNPLHGEQRVGTIGLPSGVEADIIDGHLYIQGPTMFKPGWYDTGDLAVKDTQGYYKILGRSKDQINVKGIKINPSSIEQQLKATFPEIGECVVFGSDKIKCLYTGTCDPALIKKFLLDLGPQFRPQLLALVDSIPPNPSGKLSRSWLDTNY